MRGIRVLKRERYELSQDLADCVSILKQAGIWAHAGVLQFPDQRTIAIVSQLPESLALLRSKGFRVIDDHRPVRTRANRLHRVTGPTRP
jgi:hypothetical protein